MPAKLCLRIWSDRENELRIRFMVRKRTWNVVFAMCFLIRTTKASRCVIVRRIIEPELNISFFCKLFFRLRDIAWDQVIAILFGPYRIQLAKMSDSSAMEIDQISPTGAGQASSSQPSSSFNPLTFNYLDIPRSTRSVWRHDPPIEVADGTEPKIHAATSAREYYRRMITTYVSPAVKALGTNPYPGLRQRRYIPELETHTPRYNLHRPWMGASSILQFVSKLIGCFLAAKKELADWWVPQSASRATAPRLHKLGSRWQLWIWSIASIQSRYWNVSISK